VAVDAADEELAAAAAAVHVMIVTARQASRT
jgi:hypothetical protein